jgi:YfiH family protein
VTATPAPWLIPDWRHPPRVRALVTTRDFPGSSRPPFAAGNLGDRCGDDPAAVAANRALLAARAGLPARPHWLRQVHGIAVHDARGAAASQPPVADAAHTCDAGVVLAVLTADCLPLLLCAADGSEIAAVHAGWRGLSAGVIEQAVARFACAPGALSAWLGPAIGARSYEVGDEVRAAFVDASPEAAHAFVPTRPGHWFCDLYALARQRLGALGVRQVQGGDLDTFGDTRWYSHRRERVGGRFASLIWIEAQAA